MIGLLWLFCLSGYALSRELVTTNPYKVEAAYLRNFAHYVRWPASAFANAHSPWHIGVLGGHPFGKVLEQTLQGRTEQGRSFEVFRATKLKDLPPCQIIFIACGDDAKCRAVLARLKTKPVLTVGDSPAFLQEGGIIHFQVNGRIYMDINLDQARAVSLKIQSQMLEVSRKVVEDGKVHFLR